MKKKYIIIGILIIILLFFFLVIVPKKPKTEPKPIDQPSIVPIEEVAEEKPEEIVIVEETPKKEFGEWQNQRKVTVIGFDKGAEIGVSKDESMLFFNDPDGNKNLHWATRVDDLTYQ